MIERRELKRFLNYSLIGAGTFLFDLVLLYIFTDILAFNYVVSAGVAFLIAVSCNYLLSRQYIFRGSERNHVEGYSYFIIIALTGLLFVTVSMVVLVEYLGAHYMVARVLIAGITGIWNYMMNLFFNFKVAGKYE